MNEALKYFKEYGKALERMNSSRKRLVSIWYSSKSIQYRITKAAIIRERHYRIVKDAWNLRRICRNITNKTPKKHCQTCTHLWLRLRSNSCTRCKSNPDNKAFNNLPDYWMKFDFE